MFWGIVILWLLGLLITYFIIFAAVKDAIDKSVVGQFIKTKYGIGVKEEVPIVSNEEIEKELEKEFNK